MYEHQDALEALSRKLPLSEKLTFVHQLLRERHPFVDRIAIALYDPKSDLLKTYVHSSGEAQPLSLYQARLTATPSLREILAKRKPRVVNDLSAFSGSASKHALRIGETYRSSYTKPMLLDGEFFGFLFFNSQQKDVFAEPALHDLDMVGHLISLVVINELSAIRTLLASVKTATDMAHQRDFETGSHLDRMSNYARLIARTLAKSRPLDDDLIEHIYLFAPLHDIGKIAIPDSILLKPGRLTPEEFAVMKTHVDKGREIIDTMLENFGLEGMQHVDVLRNIAQYHHETMDGGGYAGGLKGADIPLEARIVAVADVFDALTSRRPYKEPWSNEEAFAMLLEMAGAKLDRACVEGLIENEDQIRQVQARFREDAVG
jgi:HD-GYP domain-containing protein (c-di-GMP phosphodiesterase class II)